MALATSLASRARGARVFDHRLEHLRGRDDGLAILRCAMNDVLLDGRNFFRRNFDAEIAAGNHDSVGRFENAFKVLDGLRFFELGDDPGFGSEGGYAVLDQLDVFRGTDEGDGNGVDAILQCEFKIALVFFREGWDADRNAGEVDALVFAEHAAVNDFANDIVVVNFADAEFDEAIGEQQAGALFQVLGEGLESGADHIGGAENVARRDGEHLAGPQQHRSFVLEAAGTNLGTLKVAHDADALALLGGDGANHFDQFQLFRVDAVREIEAGYVEPGAHQFAEHRLAI